MKIFLRPLALALSLLHFSLLTACTQQIDLSLYADKSWRLQNDLKVENEMLDALAPQAAGFVDEEFGLNLPSLDTDSLLSGSLENLTQSYRQQGLQADWQKHETEYRLTAAGKTYEQLGVLLTGLSLEPVAGAPNQYHLRAGLPGLPAEMNLFSGLLDTVVRIHVGRIIACNDCQRQGNTALWHNPLQIDLVFSPALPPVWLYLLLGLLAALLMVGLSLALRAASRKTCLGCGSRIPRRAEYCPYCGGINV